MGMLNANGNARIQRLNGTTVRASDSNTGSPAAPICL